MSSYLLESCRRFTPTTNVDEALSEGLLLKTSTGGQEYYRCKVCSCTMAGAVPAGAHLRGSPHFKALRNYSYSTTLDETMANLRVSDVTSTSYMNTETPLGSSSLEAVKTAMENNIVKVCRDSGIVSLNCTVCNITTTGEEPMAQHLDGGSHRKRQKRMGLGQDTIQGPNTSSFHVTEAPGNTTCGFTVVGNTQSPEDLVKEAMGSGIIFKEVSGGIDTLTCKVCRKSCSGTIPMKQHLISTPHMKKLRTYGATVQGPSHRSSSPVVNRPIPRSYTVQEDGLPSYYGSDKVRETTSRASTSPTIQISDDDVVEEAKSKGVVIDFDDGLLCLLCQLPCTGKQNMKEHLQGDHHYKKYRDQIDQLIMFGGDGEMDRTSPPLQASVPKAIPTFTMQATKSQEISGQQNFQNTSSAFRLGLNIPSRISPDRVVSSRKVVSKGRLTLPENLTDLDVYFADEPLGKSF